MPNTLLLPATLQQLHAAITTALTQKTRSESAVLGERREVAVLAVQVRLQQLNGEEEADNALWIDEALRIILAVVHRYAGTIDAFEADSILTLFGVPFAHENDTERAALAALAIQQAIQPLDARLSEQHNLTLTLQIGLHSGSVIQGQTGFGELDYTMIGNSAQQAQRLQGAANDGAILASSDIYERTKANFSYRAISAAPDHPEPTYELISATRSSNIASQINIHGPIIGRTKELAALRTALEAVLQAPKGRVLLITGDAGIGKHRLIREFCNSIPTTAVRCYLMQCSPLNRVTPLFLVAEMLRALFDSTPDLALATQRDRVVQTLNRLQLVAADLLPYIEHVLGIRQPTETRNDPLRALDPSMLQRQTHLAIRQIILAAATAIPTILVLEELQWVDPASRDFFEYLIQTTRTSHNARFMLILASREYQSSTIEPLITAAKHDPSGLLDIALAPLSPTESEALVVQLLSNPTEAHNMLFHQIGLRAAGNPLYIEELVRMLLERGAFQAQQGVSATSQRVEQILQHVPDTLQGLLAARFGSLSERMRRVLQRIAVLGRSFTLRLLHQLEPGSVSQLVVELDELITRRFLTAEPSETEQNYSFQNAMLQESIYQTLLLPDRQRLHGQAAQAIETDQELTDDERTQLLAYHYAESALPQRAVSYLIAVAERSARRYANETAIQHYRRTLRLIGDSTYDSRVLAAVRIGLGRTLKFNGQYDEAIQILTTAVAHLRSSYTSTSDIFLLFLEALRELAESHQRTGELELAVVALTEGLQHLEHASLQTYRIIHRTLIDRLAAVRFREGDLDAAYRLATEITSQHLDDEDPDPVTLASLYNTLGGVLWQRGELALASQSVEQSLYLYQQVNYSWGMATAYTNLGILNYAIGRWPQAIEQFQRSEVLRKEIGYLPERAVNLKNLGVLQMEMGDHDQARQSFEESLASSRSISDDYGVVVALLQLADLALLQQRIAESRDYLTQAAVLLSAAGEDERTLFYWLTGLIEAAENQPELAIEHINEALELAIAAGIPDLEIDCRRVLGTLKGQCGDLDLAEQQLQIALALSIEHASTFREGLVHYELGWHYRRLAQQPGSDSQSEQARARTSYELAQSCFASLNARYELQRVNSALQRLV